MLLGYNLTMNAIWKLLDICQNKIVLFGVLCLRLMVKHEVQGTFGSLCITRVDGVLQADVGSFESSRSSS
jgi:hypothetical protein